MTEAVSVVQQVMRAAMAELVQHMRDRLQDGPDGKPARFHQTTVSKLVSFLDTFELRNVTDDAELKSLVDQAKALLSGVSIKDLKTAAELRTQVREGMADIAAQLDTLIVRKGTRKLRLDE
jgi:hypothetical protein